MPWNKFQHPDINELCFSARFETIFDSISIPASISSEHNAISETEDGITSTTLSFLVWSVFPITICKAQVTLHYKIWDSHSLVAGDSRFLRIWHNATGSLNTYSFFIFRVKQTYWLWIWRYSLTSNTTQPPTSCHIPT